MAEVLNVLSPDAKRIPLREFRAYADRLERAIVRAGLSSGQLARKAEESREFIMRCLPVAIGGSASVMPNDGLRVIIPDILDCDARWLATGMLSDAAMCAINELSKHATVPGLARDFELLTQPPGEEEVCRYCGATFAEGWSVGAEWVDYLHTICSHCLEVPHA